MEEIHKIVAKNYDQYRFMRFQTIAEKGVLVSRPDDENRRFFYLVRSCCDIFPTDMIQAVSQYLHDVGFDKYEQRGKLVISCQMNGQKYELQSDDVSMI